MMLKLESLKETESSSKRKTSKSWRQTTLPIEELTTTTSPLSPELSKNSWMIKSDSNKEDLKI
jgi:hypothetical protein